MMYMSHCYSYQQAPAPAHQRWIHVKQKTRTPLAYLVVMIISVLTQFEYNLNNTIIQDFSTVYLNFSFFFQFYLKNENDDNKRLNIQKINQSLFIIYEWKDQSNLSPNQSTYIKYFNEDDPVSTYTSCLRMSLLYKELQYELWRIKRTFGACIGTAYFGI